MVAVTAVEVTVVAAAVLVVLEVGTVVSVVPAEAPVVPMADPAALVEDILDTDLHRRLWEAGVIADRAIIIVGAVWAACSRYWELLQC